MCPAWQGLVLRVATYIVLRWGSSLSSFSAYKFFTFCWQRLSASSQQRWTSLRTRATTAAAAWGALRQPSSQQDEVSLPP